MMKFPRSELIVVMERELFQLFDQGIPEMILSRNIDEAIEKAADYLKVLYPGIYKQIFV
jgi:hypothetical protein